MQKLLQKLSEAFGPSGREQTIAALVADAMRPWCDEVEIDAMANVVGIKRGGGPDPRPRLMLMAHSDEIAMMVTAIEGEFLRFRPHGYDPRQVVGQTVIIYGRETIRGVVGDRPPHLLDAEQRRHMPSLQELVIDTGLDAETLAEVVQVGDSVLIDRSMLHLLGERVAGKAFDNRLSLTAVLGVLEALQNQRHPCDVLAVASVGEEVNLLGAQTASFALRPDLAIVLDVTFGRQPGTPDLGSFKLGCGPVIGVGPNFHPRITEKLLDLCDTLEIPHERELLAGNTGTDAWMVQVAAGGIPVGLVGMAIRNMHSPVEVADLKDLQRTIRLLTAFAAQTDQTFVDDLSYPLPDFTEATP
jgi:endoglucanase